MIIAKPLEKLIDMLAGILAMVVMIFILVLYINAKVSFLSAETLQTMSLVREVGILLVVGAKALEFALKRNIILAIICVAIIIAVFVLVFFPNVAPVLGGATEALSGFIR